MAEITHRYINGMEVSFSELNRYQITNRIILDIINNAVRRIHSDQKNEAMQAALNNNAR